MTNHSEMITVKLRVATLDGLFHGFYPAKAGRCGQVCVHHASGYQSGVAVTHIASGACITHFKYFEDARAFALQLAAIDLDADWQANLGKKDTAQAKAVIKLLNKSYFKNQSGLWLAERRWSERHT